MATRQEMVCAINLIRHTARANGHLKSVIKILDGTTILVDEEGEPLSLEGMKTIAKGNCADVHGLTGRIKVVPERVDPIFLDAGITDVALRATGEPTYYLRSDISLDVSNVNTRSAQAEQLLNVAIDGGDLELITANLKGINLKIGVVEPDPWELFPMEVNHANILHDILDALSYELQGLSSYTGQLHELTDQQKDKLFSNRVFTANIYLSHLPNNEDRQELGGILSYIETNIGKAKNAAQLAKIGKYIDGNLPKLIMVRRWWAL